MTARLWHSPGYPVPPELVAEINVPVTLYGPLPALPIHRTPKFVIWRDDSGRLRLFRCVAASPEGGAEYVEEDSVFQVVI